MHLTGRLFDPITFDTQWANQCMLSGISKVSNQRQPLTTIINGIDWRWGRCGWKATRCLAVINIWFWLSDDDIDEYDNGEDESDDGDDERGAFLASHQLVLQICPRICWCLIHSVASCSQKIGLIWFCWITTNQMHSWRMKYIPRHT